MNTKLTQKSARPLAIAGLDIGSSKVSVVIAIVDQANPENPKLDIVGLGTAPNTGIRQGIVVNIEATAESIRKAREEAELMSGYKIEDVWVGVSGSHIKSFDSKGMVAIKNKEVTHLDVDRVIDAAKAVAVPTDRTVLHVLPREYKVDGQDGILDPVGMSGIRLEASVHIVTSSQTAMANNVKCIEKAGLKVMGFVLDPLASAMSVLSEDEKALGVCVVDMGAGSCNSVYFVHGSLAHTSVVPVGGQHFTHDVAIGLRTPQVAAEELKQKYGCAMAALAGDEETIEVEGVGGRKARTVLRRDLAEVIEPRAEETLQMIANDLRMSGLLPLLGSGVVLTGGASQLDGLIEMGEFIFDVPVRRGIPIGSNDKVAGLTEVVKSGAFSTSVGLLLYGLAQKKFSKASSTKNEDAIADSINSFGTKVKTFIEGLF
ncbi:MAG: cell division protein FtsA [Pseudobdellovibrionaceae bacterium]